jgi:hypothetical protein
MLLKPKVFISNVELSRSTLPWSRCISMGTMAIKLTARIQCHDLDFPMVKLSYFVAKT